MHDTAELFLPCHISRANYVFSREKLLSQYTWQLSLWLFELTLCICSGTFAPCVGLRANSKELNWCGPTMSLEEGKKRGDEVAISRNRERTKKKRKGRKSLTRDRGETITRESARPVRRTTARLLGLPSSVRARTEARKRTRGDKVGLNLPL